MNLPAPRPHVLLIAVGTAGDLYPFLRIAAELRARGHRVTLLAPPVHAEAVARAGLPFHALGTVEAFHAALEFWSAMHGFVLLEMTGVMGEVDTDALFSDMVLRLATGLDRRTAQHSAGPN